MSQWQNSTRRQRLPSNWPQIRKRVLARDGKMCQVQMDDGTICLDDANEVDHIKAGDNHSDANLQAICRWHHKRKSSHEGGVAAQAKARRIRSSFKRVEDHPGLM